MVVLFRDVCPSNRQVADSQGIRVFAAIVGSGPEIRAESPWEGVGEGEDVGAIGHVEEGQLSPLVVQEDAHAAGRHAQGERHALRVQHEVLAAVPQPHHPVAGGRAQARGLRARHRGQARAQEPAAAAAHVHLPVVAARDKALAAQHARLPQEPLRIAGCQARRPPARPHALAILRDLQAGMRGGWIQGHVHYAEAQG